MIDYEKVANLLVEYFMRSQEAYCLLCDNHMKNILIQRDGSCSQGCDGNCRHDKKYTKDDLLQMFIKESQK